MKQEIWEMYRIESSRLNLHYYKSIELYKIYSSLKGVNLIGEISKALQEQFESVASIFKNRGEFLNWFKNDYDGELLELFKFLVNFYKHERK